MELTKSRKKVNIAFISLLDRNMWPTHNLSMAKKHEIKLHLIISIVKPEKDKFGLFWQKKSRVMQRWSVLSV